MKWLDRHTVFAPHLALCLNEKDFDAAVRHCKVKDPGPWLDPERHRALVHTWELCGRLTCVVCLHPEHATSDPIEVAGSLVHEAVHIFQKLCQSIGEHSPSSEFEAYSIQRIAETLMREYARQTGGSK